MANKDFHIKAFYKASTWISYLRYANRLKALGLATSELRRLHHNLLYSYEVLFGKIIMDCAHNMFSVAQCTTTTAGNCIQIIVNITSINVF